MHEFPTHPDALTPHWLGEVLGWPVQTVDWEPIGTGQVGDTFRLTVSGPDSRGTDTLAAKFPADDATSRATAAMFGLYRKEVCFYRQAAPLIEARVPKVHFAEVSDDGAAFILLFEDLGPARQGDQIASCEIADAKAAMVQAAAIHAPSWGRSDWLQSEWLQPAEGQAERVGTMYGQAQAIFRDRYGDVLEPEYMEVCDALAESGDSYFQRNDPPQCMIHGDFRLDNMLFEISGGAEPIAVLDWQTVSAGNAMIDVAYFIGCGIGEAMWRAHEDSLLDLYLNEMRGRGVALARDDIWRDYRIAALHGVSTAVFSAAFVQRTARGDENFLSMARGACSLALERDSIGALRGES